MMEMAVVTAWHSYSHRTSSTKIHTGKDTRIDKKLGTGQDTKSTKTKKIGTQRCRETLTAKTKKIGTTKTTSAGSETTAASDKTGHGQTCKATITAAGYKIKDSNDRRGGNLGQIGKMTKVGNKTTVGKNTTICKKTPALAGGTATSRRAQRLESMAGGTRSVRSLCLARQTTHRRRQQNDGDQTIRAITRPD